MRLLKFYRDDPVKVKNLRWYSHKRWQSFAVKHNHLIGGRGYGKTYPLRLDFLHNFQKTGETFFWTRTTDRALDAIRDPNQFFGRIKPEHLKWLEIENYDIKNDRIYINKKLCGYYFAVSTFYNNKGADYNCTRGCWDEFMRAKGERPLAGKREKFMDLCQSVLRDDKNARVVYLSNSTNQFDEVLKYYEIKLNDFGVYLYREENALIHYIRPSETFLEAQKDSISFTGASDHQKKMMYENKFTDYGEYGKLSKAKYLFSIQCDDDAFLSFYEYNMTLYVKPNIPDNPWIKSVNPIFVNSNVNKLTQAEKKYLTTMYERGKVIFIDGYCRVLFQETFYGLM